MNSSHNNNDNGILSIKPLPAVGPMPTLDPFLFCVYHKDAYPPAVNDQDMQAPRAGNGADFDPNADYRMYHGTDGIPGFPQHPHRGFETITATLNGIVDHADSMGNAGRYGHGDCQWMTAGKGVVHSEMFPLIHTHNTPNPLVLFQIWLNLPAHNKMVDPSFAMFWAHQVPIYKQQDEESDGATVVTMWAGRDYFHSGDNNHPPPPHSWAADPHNDVAVWHIKLPAGAQLTLPPAHEGNEVHRNLFYLEGPDHGVTLNEEPLKRRVVVHVAANRDVVLQNTLAQNGHDDSSSSTVVEFLLLQGRPIGEPVAQHGPFVMNTRAEIQQAFREYSATQFGGWPWPRDDMVFDRTKPRFAKLGGIETVPPPPVVVGKEEMLQCTSKVEEEEEKKSQV